MAYTHQPITHQYTMFNGEMVDSELVYYYQMYEDALRKMKVLYPSYDSQPYSTSEWLHSKLGIVGDNLNKIIKKLSSIFKDFHIEFG